MLFPTLHFGLFFLAVFFASWALAKRTDSRKLLLVAASYGFYAMWDWRFCVLLALSSLGNWAVGRALANTQDEAARKPILLGAVALNLAVLGFFKYADFFLLSLESLLNAAGLARDLPLLSLVVPVAISFFTFHAISYLVDIHRGHVRAPAGLLDMALYLSFFPQLVAGPIVRAAHFLPQIAAPADPDRIAMTRAFLLIAIGLFKKVFVATWLASLHADEMFRDPSLYKAGDLLLGMYAYALQIYCDFSAYTDIAIGVAALLGYRFPVNFDQPYRAASPSEFWKRWHISLSSWLRDYLYIPLGGDAGGLRTYVNLALVMLLGGLWHGAAWHFVIWGALHGAALIVARAWPIALPRALAIALTFHFVCVTWVFFRAGDAAKALDYLAGLQHLALPVHASGFVMILIVLGIASQFLPKDRLMRTESRVLGLPAWAQGVALGAAIVAVDAIGPAGVAPFIYFQF